MVFAFGFMNYYLKVRTWQQECSKCAKLLINSGYTYRCSIYIWPHVPNRQSSRLNSPRRCRLNSSSCLPDLNITGPSNSSKRRGTIGQEYHIPQTGRMVYCILLLGTYSGSLEQFCTTCRQGKVGFCWLSACESSHWSWMVRLHDASCSNGHGFYLS